MSYFKLKGDLEFFEAFRIMCLRFMENEDKIGQKILDQGARFYSNDDYLSAIRNIGGENHEYLKLREELAIMIPRAKNIAHNTRTNFVFTEYPAPIVGGPIINISIYDAILQDTSREGVDKQFIRDSLAQTTGALKEQTRIAFQKLINPIYWLGELIRLPFQIISFAGFDGESLETSVIGKIFKLIAGFAAFLASIVAVYPYLKLAGPIIRKFIYNQ